MVGWIGQIIVPCVDEAEDLHTAPGPKIDIVNAVHEGTAVDNRFHDGQSPGCDDAPPFGWTGPGLPALEMQRQCP
jgi:hypothetical protein